MTCKNLVGPVILSEISQVKVSVK